MISLPLPLAGFFAWLHALVPAQAEGLLDLVLPSSYDALPFDVAVVVAPEQSGAGEVSAAGAADFQVIFHRGTLLPCFEMLEFSTSVPNQTIHKTAFYIGYEGETLNGFRRIQEEDIGGTCEFLVNTAVEGVEIPTHLNVSVFPNGTIFLETDSDFINCIERFDQTFFFVPALGTFGAFFEFVPSFVRGREYAVLIGFSSMLVMLGNLLCCNNAQRTQPPRDRKSVHDHKSLMKVQSDASTKQCLTDIAVDEDGAITAAIAAEQADTTSRIIESTAVAAADTHQSTQNSTLQVEVGHELDCCDPTEASSSSTRTGPCAVTDMDRASTIPVRKVLPSAIADAGEENVEVGNDGDNGVMSADAITGEVAHAPHGDQSEALLQAQVQNLDGSEMPPPSSAERDVINDADRNAARALVGAAAFAAALRVNQIGLEALYRVPRHRWDWPMYAAVGFLAWKLR